MNTENPQSAEVVRAIESLVPDDYGRMPIPCELDEELYEQIKRALSCEPRSELLLNQFGFDSLLQFIERKSSECLREAEFEHCQQAAQALEVLLFQPDYDEHVIEVALALIQDSYQRLKPPRPGFDAGAIPLFCAAWDRLNSQQTSEKQSGVHHFRLGEDQDGPRYTCYW
ncbi:hypothetical protein [Gimesia panareensis]|uniref:hypothetical protein n=1 Tax=Gimesia panareensis TaxID=2527978 RepID=UPI00118ACE49|nr:hypothetical protein [Gimesia panareensis]QDU52516.1 hypothetical protein Pan110_48950 [Gimesia panareensis]